MMVAYTARLLHLSDNLCLSATCTTVVVSLFSSKDLLIFIHLDVLGRLELVHQLVLLGAQLVLHRLGFQEVFLRTLGHLVWDGGWFAEVRSVVVEQSGRLRVSVPDVCCVSVLSLHKSSTLIFTNVLRRTH